MKMNKLMVMSVKKERLKNMKNIFTEWQFLKALVFNPGYIDHYHLGNILKFPSPDVIHRDSNLMYLRDILSEHLNCFLSFYFI